MKKHFDGVFEKRPNYHTPNHFRYKVTDAQAGLGSPILTSESSGEKTIGKTKVIILL